MREIKFRAWHKTLNILREVMDIEFGVYVAIRDDDEFPYVVMDVEDRIILMQYANHKDINGKEIYEGDICEYGDITTESWMISKKKKTGVVTYIPSMSALMLVDSKLDLDSAYSRCGFMWAEGIEVKGNIYENPDYFGEKKNEA